MYTNRPDRPLVVKCSYDTWNKKITFSSARNCTYEVLRHKVEQCFSLSSTSFGIAYKDDDGEITNITTDSDLAEAIQYFQAGDDAPLSSAASILSGRSFGSRKVTLRVHIVVEYDGPSLSDTSSLVSLDEYRGRNGSQQSFSFTSPSLDLDDDSVTVSSRDNSAVSAGPPYGFDHAVASGGSERFTVISRPTTVPKAVQAPLLSGSSTTDPVANDIQCEISETYKDSASAVFERLKIQDTLSEGWTSVDRDTMARNDRGVAWLKDQNERAIRSRLGPLPEPSISDEISLVTQSQEELGGALELERDPHGRYYYTYTSAGPASQGHDSASDDLEGVNSHRPRPTSMQLDWLASQQIPPQDTRSSKFSQGNHLDTESSTHHSINLQNSPFFIIPVPPLDRLTDCSECGSLLDGIRYVCATCGEKFPVGNSDSVNAEGEIFSSPDHSYPPFLSSKNPPSSSQVFSISSQTYVGSSDSLVQRYGATSSDPANTTATRLTKGYELCSRCLQSAGVNHAIEAGIYAGSPLGISSPASPENSQAASQWRRATPKKGQLRHAYHEKVLGQTGWEDVEQDEAQVSKCSTCEAITFRRRYKCASCPNINLCRACYSQVHELHPSHAFITVPDKRVLSSEPEYFNLPIDASEEQSLKHPGVKCAHCLLDIVGARFHCAICDSVDICANCESAGLPGNLDSADGGHTSSHILIKIPYPLETNELESASRWAIHLWTGRDAASVGLPAPRSKPSSVVSSYARTVMGSGSKGSKSSLDDHHMFCNGCNRPIIGIRYQCACCPSSPRAYNLCQDCETRSYNLHDPMHVFFKLPRPVQRPIESQSKLVPLLYTREPIFPESSTAVDPKAYLQSLVHSFALCDRCMTAITGEWFRCAYCPLDLCDACEEVDTHDDSHVFLVFKSTVDMYAFRKFANLDTLDEQPPAVIPYRVYK